MPSLLQQLANNEAVLMMYLADELPEEDRAEVEQMLQTDAGLRAELERLREAHQTVTDALAQADLAIRIPPPAMTLRRLSRHFRQWQVDQQEPEVEEPEQRRRWPIWGYPAAAVAVIALVLGIWWSALPDDPYSGDPMASRAFFFTEPSPETLELTKAFESPPLEDRLRPLYDTEQELAVLQELGL